MNNAASYLRVAIPYDLVEVDLQHTSRELIDVRGGDEGRLPLHAKLPTIVSRGVQCLVNVHWVFITTPTQARGANPRSD